MIIVVGFFVVRLIALQQTTAALATAADFTHFAITAHNNGYTNPNAFLQKRIDFDTTMNSRMLVDPVKLFDAPPVCDGGQPHVNSGLT